MDTYRLTMLSSVRKEQVVEICSWAGRNDSAGGPKLFSSLHYTVHAPQSHTEMRMSVSENFCLLLYTYITHMQWYIMTIIRHTTLGHMMIARCQEQRDDAEQILYYGKKKNLYFVHVGCDRLKSSRHTAGEWMTWKSKRDRERKSKRQKPRLAPNRLFKP